MKRVVVLLGVVAALAGACGDDPVAPGAGGDEDDALRGRTFLSQSVAGHELVADTQVRVTFNDDGTIGASAGCNQFVGELEMDAGALFVTNLGGTEMGCDEPRHAQDQWMVEFLSSRPTYTLDDGGTLTLTSGQVEVVLVDRKVADPDQPLVGTRWVVDTILEGDSASSVPHDVEAWVVFGDDGKVSGHDGCNGFGAEYQVDGGTITIRDRVGTLIGCRDDVMRLANAVGAGTNGAVTYEIEAKRLTLTGDGGKGVSLVASDG